MTEKQAISLIKKLIHLVRYYGCDGKDKECRCDVCRKVYQAKKMISKAEAK